MQEQIQKDEAQSTKKSSDVRYENKSQVNCNSGVMSGEQSAAFIPSVNHAMQLKSQGQLVMQFVKVEPKENTAWPIQRKSSGELCGGQPQESAKMQSFSIQRKVNNTGLPDNLKSGIENLSGYSMDDVKVHYNSSKPTRLQAYAFAQGTDIHLAPRQERHLPHEAWHVVQQKQGRVRPTIQMKGKVGVNDDAGLEREADLMGERALRMDRVTSPLKVCSPLQTSVVQCRIPTMDHTFIAENTQMAVEILIHAVRNLSEEELAPVFNNTTYTNTDEIVEALQREDNDTVFDVYTFIYENTPASKRYLAESSAANPGETRQIQAILGHLSGIDEILTGLIDNNELLELVFGADVNKPIEVLRNVKNRINHHIETNTCPVRIIGNNEHNLWVGVAGMTSFNAEYVVLSPAVFLTLVNGTSRAKATLIHELTHLTSDTTDYAYTQAGCQKLGPNKRVNNAETYAHAFLHQIGEGEDWQLYNPEVSLGKQKVNRNGKKQSKEAAIRQKRFGELKGMIVEIWNHTDSAYLAAQKYLLAVQHGEKGDNVDLMLANAALTPHKPSFTVGNAPKILSLIEDRTKALNSIKTDLKNTIKSYSYDFLASDDGEPMPLLVNIISEKFKINQEAANFWVYAMHDPINYLSW